MVFGIAPVAIGLAARADLTAAAVGGDLDIAGFVIVLIPGEQTCGA